MSYSQSPASPSRPSIGGPRLPDDATCFNYDAIPIGYYQEVAESGHPVRRAWHLQKFNRIIECMPKTPGQSILDIGCFAGTFLSLLPGSIFSFQLGVDILEKQTAYANQRFGTPFRSFRHIHDVSCLAKIEQKFDCVTLIEVIEHLHETEIDELFRQISERLNDNGLLILSTPNYASCWPLLEIAVNRLSEVSYEEQHVTKFNYFTCLSKLQRISRAMSADFELVNRTTTHFLAPFLASISLKLSMKLSSIVPFQIWKNPFGNLILLSFRKKAATVLSSQSGEARHIDVPRRAKAA